MSEIILETEKLKKAIDLLFLGTENSALNAEQSKCYYFKNIGKDLYCVVSSQNIAISTLLLADIDCDIDFVVDAKKFRHLVTKTSKKSISLLKEEGEEGEDSTWKIKGVGRYTLKNQSYELQEEYFTEDLSEPLFSIESSEMASAFEQCVFFVNEERQDPHLRNFYFDGNMVATDKKSIQMVTTSVNKEGLQILIPQIFYDVCSKLENTVNFYDMESYYIAESGDYKVRLNKIAGADQFPDYQQFITQCENEYSSYVEVNRKEFLEALERVSPFTEKAFYFRVPISIKDNKLTISVDEGDIVEEELDCVAEGDIEIAFNGQYLKRAAEICEAEKIKIIYGTFDQIALFSDTNSKLLLVPVSLEVQE